MSGSSSAEKWTPESVQQALARFKAKADEFETLRQKMVARPVEQRVKMPPALQDRYGKVLQKADALQNAVVGVRDKFQSTMQWLQDVTGMAASELGAVPIVVAGYVAGIVGVTWVIGNTLSEMRQVDREAEATISGKPLTPGMKLSPQLQAWGKKLVWPAVILVALWVLPKLSED